MTAFQKAVLPMKIPIRPWREIARELAHEPNEARASELSQELNGCNGGAVSG